MQQHWIFQCWILPTRKIALLLYSYKKAKKFASPLTYLDFSPGIDFAFLLVEVKMKTKHRNTRFVMQESFKNYQKAIQSGLMQVSIQGRHNKQVVLDSGEVVTEFINCSYLGLDLHPKVQEAYRKVPEHWGVNFCCARSRFSLDPLINLEQRLSDHFKGRVVTFPSVTTTHVAVLPLVASGLLLPNIGERGVRLVFDRFAHSSMQFLKPIASDEAEVVTIGHNDLQALMREVHLGKEKNQIVVYVCDGVYSMGGAAPLPDLLELAEEHDFYLYIDDAHGTSIFGNKGVGPVLSLLPDGLPSRIILTFALSKGFGTNGGGVLVPTRNQETLIRTYGQVYGFSAALDTSAVYASHAALDLHQDGTVDRLQSELRDRIRHFDSLFRGQENYSPIRMVHVGDDDRAVDIGEKLIKAGFFVSVVFFPIVPRGQAQLRICLAANHTNQDITDLYQAIMRISPDLLERRNEVLSATA